MTLRWALDTTSRYGKWDGYDITGRKIAKIETTDRGRFVATLHHVRITPAIGTTSLDAAKAITEATAGHLT